MIAIVTGGTRGIGLAIVEELLKKNFTCIVSARAITSEIDNYIKQGKAVKFFPCDIAISQERLALVEFALQFGEIDLLVNNAGVAPKVRKDILEVDEESYDYVLDINLKGTFFLTQAVANAMSRVRQGKIVNIGSISSYTSSTARAEYCMSKAGISMMTKLFAERMAEYEVGVFEISPGIILTDMTEKVKGKYSQLIDEGITPIKRFGLPQDIANCVSAIVSGALDFCTGTVLNCDGGFSVRRL